MAFVLAFLAGLLTSLSPCVLPVLPLVVGAAFTEHRFGPLALCAGLGLSFSVLGVVVTLAVHAIGFDPSVIRIGSALLLLLFGMTLLLTPVQEWLSRLLAPLASKAGGVKPRHGLSGNFVTGTLLGAVWSPCSGPTLGSAVGLATQSATAARGFLLMLVFALAANLPLLAIAYGARSAFVANRARLIAVSARAKPFFGAILVIVSMAILLGADKRAEAAIVRGLPESWVDWTTKF